MTFLYQTELFGFHFVFKTNEALKPYFLTTDLSSDVEGIALIMLISYPMGCDTVTPQWEEMKQSL